MKIKTVEKIINLKNLYEIVQSVIQSQFKIETNSFIKESILYVNALDKNSKVLQLVAFNELEFKRTIIAISILNSENLSFKKKKFKLSDSKLDYLDKKTFFQLIDPIDSIDYSERKGIYFNELEATFINDIQDKINYEDKLLKYPFSLTGNFNINEDWYASYSDNLDLIERNIIKYGVNQSRIFRYYDFAKNSETFQRIFDLIVISDKLVKKIDDNVYWLLFYYSNKSQEKFKLLNLVKLFDEIKKYSKVLQKTMKKRGSIIKPALIILSVNGFEKSVSKYLRNHLYGEFEYIIPIFIIPPNKEKIWHNLTEDRMESAELTKRKDAIKSNVNRYRNINNSAAHRTDHIEVELKRLSDIKKRIILVEKHSNLIKFFSENLSIKETEVVGLKI
ncbi:MAG: hypothetical protein ACTSP9_09905 [Promethearchaeota archaeon]